MITNLLTNMKKWEYKVSITDIHEDNVAFFLNLHSESGGYVIEKIIPIESDNAIKCALIFKRPIQETNS